MADLPGTSGLRTTRETSEPLAGERDEALMCPTVIARPPRIASPRSSVISLISLSSLLTVCTLSVKINAAVVSFTCR